MLTPADLPPLPGLQATRRALDEGQIGAQALLEACITRIQAHNPRLNALVTLNLDAAREQARAADLQLARGRSADQPLLGIPVSIKDAFETAGLRTTASYPPLAGHVPARDATLVARLRAAGAVLVGKSNLSCLAGDPQCWSPLFGPTHNPWQHGLTPGGSSGGSAVAVAMGFSLLELGSDIGGSIRIPAAYCGVAGFKATENRLPRTGHIPHLPGGQRSVRRMLSFGVLAPRVDDLALALPLLAGPDGEDLEVPPIPWQPVSAMPARPLRIAWWDDFPGLPLCPRTRAGLERTVARLQEAGHTLERCRLSAFEFETAARVGAQLLGAQLAADAPWLQRRLMGLAAHLLPQGQPVGRGFLAGHALGLAGFSRLLARRDALIAALEAHLTHYDALLCPVAPMVAYPAFPPSRWRPPPRVPAGAGALPWIEAATGLCLPFSATGSPVLSIPVGVFDGLPVGLQLVGRRWGDEALLALGRQLEQDLGA